MSENINTESVRGLVEGMTPGPWRAPRVGVAETITNPANAALIAAAPSIARAYLALSERVGELEREKLGSLRFLGAVVLAAGGEIRIHHSHMEEVTRYSLEQFDDVADNSVVVRAALAQPNKEQADGA